MNTSYRFKPINEQKGIYLIKVGQKDIMTKEEGKIVYIVKVIASGYEIDVEEVAVIGGYMPEELLYDAKCLLLDCLEKDANDGFAHDVLVRLPSKKNTHLESKEPEDK
ncbi:hypothetical protein [Sediminibacillus sp. JSM 1682029]|uniref:hypothetical protein n=1 Tax=Sediminibacillus sp. JSM 1682029 TaxID=3229857 RepID=UPI003524F44B